MLLLSLAAAASAQTSGTTADESELKSAFKAVVADHPDRAEWGSGALHERRGQICDSFRTFGQPAGPVADDNLPGCAVGLALSFPS